MVELLLNLSLYLLIFPLCFLLGFNYLFSASPFVSASRLHGLFITAIAASFFSVVLPFVLPKFLSLGLPAWLGELLPKSWLNTYWQAIVGIYLLGLFWCLFYLLLGFVAIKQLSKTAIDIPNSEISQHFLSSNLCCTSASKAGLDEKALLEKVRFKTSRDITSPLVWGGLNPVILLPANYQHWSRDRIVRIVLHELAHVKRHDWTVKILVQILCALMWYLLPVWFIAKKVDWFAELACDDAVINRVRGRAEYAQDLLDIARSNRQGYLALAFNQGSQLYSRISAVLDGARDREAGGQRTQVFITVLALCMVLLASTLQASIAAPSKALSHSFRGKQYPLVVTQWPASSMNKVNMATTGQPGYHEPFDLRQLPARGQAPVLPKRDDEELVVVAPAQRKLLLQKVPQLSLTIPVKEPLKSSPQVTFKGYLPVKMVTPQYPRRALSKGIEGRVIAQFDVNHLGHVENIRIVYAQPAKLFNKSVIRALSQFKFMPLRLGGEAIKTKNVTETFVFSLQEPTTDNKKQTPFNGSTQTAKSAYVQAQ